MVIIVDKEISIKDVIEVARNKRKVELSLATIEDTNKSNQLLHNIIHNGKPTYGINTGFGCFANKNIDEMDITQLNRNLIISHAVGIGRPLDEDVVRAAMFIRAATLSRGYSGIRLEVIQTLIDMLNTGVTPVIPSQGSLGSSGDLCPLSHLALVISTDEADLDAQSGIASYNGKQVSGKKAMEEAGVKRVILGPKEGLALNNGATFSAAIGALAVNDAEYLLEIAEYSAALSMEALCACPDAFDDRIHQVRGQPGQIETAKAIRGLIDCSTLINSKDKVQDAYSLRCVPQVHGAIKDSVRFVRGVIEREINAVTDNPLIFEPGVALSGGNFHGEPIGLAMDFLSISLCELGAISERRVFRLTDEKLNEGLPGMLVDSGKNAGVNSGLMLPQYAAASLVLENQTLATPDSIRSLPTSANQEDHNANSMTAARHAAEIIENLRYILSIELYTAVHAIELRLKERQGKLGTGTQQIYDKVRAVVPYFEQDTLWGLEIEKITNMLRNHAL